MRKLKSIFTALLLLCCTVANAHDFEVNGIYYNILSEEDKTVEVTYKGESYNEYKDEYRYLSIFIPKSVTYKGTTYNVTKIGNDTFRGCNTPTTIEIPNSVTTIGASAFYSCSYLLMVNIPNSVTTIGVSAFEGCSGLRNIEIPNSVTTIGSFAFCNCNRLTSIEIPNSVTTIGNGAFVLCTSLSNVTIGKNVRKIGNQAFDFCDNIDYLTSHIPAEKLFSISTNTFTSYLKKNCTLYVPYGAIKTYATIDGWKDFNYISQLSAKTFDLTVSAAGYATLYLDYDATIPAGVEVYTANTVKGNKLMLQQVTGTLPANTAVIVKAEQGTYTFAQSDEEVAAIENNLLCGSVEDEYITPEKNAKYYVLAMKDGVVGMYEDALSGGTFKNNAHKAYLQLKPQLGIYDEEVDTENPGMQLSNSYYFDFNGTTAIEPVINKVEENVYYDLSGRRVENPVQGIYIVNGRKVLIK